MRFNVHPHAAVLSLVLLILLPSIARAEDAYFNVAVKSLHLTEGTLPKPTTQPGVVMLNGDPQYWPRVILDGPGEAFVGMIHDDQGWQASPPPIPKLELRSASAVGRGGQRTVVAGERCDPVGHGSSAI